VAAALSQILLPLIQNPVTVKALGARQILDYATRIAHLAGVDRDFILRPMPGSDMTPEQEKAQAQKQMEQLLALVDKRIDAKLIQDLEPLLKEVKQIQTELAALYRHLGAAPLQPPTPPQTPQNVPPVSPPNPS